MALSSRISPIPPKIASTQFTAERFSTISDQRNRALAAKIDIGLVDQHWDVGMLFEQLGDRRARQCDAGWCVGIGDYDRSRLALIVLDPDAHSVVQRHGLAGNAEQLRPHGIKAV